VLETYGPAVAVASQVTPAKDSFPWKGEEQSVCPREVASKTKNDGEAPLTTANTNNKHARIILAI